MEQIKSGYAYWDNCEHEWELDEFDDWYSTIEYESVKCAKCKVPGQRTIKTGEVYWPAT